MTSRCAHSMYNLMTLGRNPELEQKMDHENVSLFNSTTKLSFQPAYYWEFSFHSTCKLLGIFILFNQHITGNFHSIQPAYYWEFPLHSTSILLGISITFNQHSTGNFHFIQPAYYRDISELCHFRSVICL